MIGWMVRAASTPPPTETFDATEVSPGVVGFLATFAVVLAAIVLFQLLTRSLRRAARNARAQGIEVVESARVGGRVQLPVREPAPAAPGLLDGGSPYAPQPPGGAASDDAAGENSPGTPV